MDGPCVWTRPCARIYALRDDGPDALSGFDLPNDRNRTAPYMRRPGSGPTVWGDYPACAGGRPALFGRYWLEVSIPPQVVLKVLANKGVVNAGYAGRQIDRRAFVNTAWHGPEDRDCVAGPVWRLSASCCKPCCAMRLADPYLPGLGHLGEGARRNGAVAGDHPRAGGWCDLRCPSRAFQRGRACVPLPCVACCAGSGGRRLGLARRVMRWQHCWAASMSTP